MVFIYLFILRHRGSKYLIHIKIHYKSATVKYSIKSSNGLHQLYALPLSSLCGRHST